MAKRIIKLQNLCQGRQRKIPEEEAHWVPERGDGSLITRGEEQGLKQWLDWEKRPKHMALSQMAGRFGNG